MKNRHGVLLIRMLASHHTRLAAELVLTDGTVLLAATFSARSLILASANTEDLWAMRDVCGFLVASPTEVPKPGYDYAALAGHLLQPDRPNLQAVCEDFHSLYAPGGKQGFYGACVKVADCRKMEGPAEVCRTLFDRHRASIRTLDGGTVQAYGESGKEFPGLLRPEGPARVPRPSP